MKVESDTMEGKNLIGGKWVARNNKLISINPSNEEILVQLLIQMKKMLKMQLMQQKLAQKIEAGMVWVIR